MARSLRQILCDLFVARGFNPQFIDLILLDAREGGPWNAFLDDLKVLLDGLILEFLKKALNGNEGLSRETFQGVMKAAIKKCTPKRGPKRCPPQNDPAIPPPTAMGLGRKRPLGTPGSFIIHNICISLRCICICKKACFSNSYYIGSMCICSAFLLLEWNTY